MAISVVIPNYNGAELLSKHLKNVLACMRDGDELIIVDDLSQDESVSKLVEFFELNKALVTPQLPSLPKHYNPQVSDMQFEIYFGKYERSHKKLRVVVVVNPENLRFGATANIGVALAANEHVFLINNDVSPSPDVLGVLENHFEDERVFAVGCLEFQSHLSNEKSGKNKLWFEKGLFHHSKAADFEFGHTAWASGGSAMFDQTKWLSLGGFDRIFFPAYWEDIDLSHRARKAGFSVLFDPNAIVYHHHESTNSSVFDKKSLLEMSWKNADRFSWRHANLLQKIKFMLWRSYWHSRRKKVLSELDRSSFDQNQSDSLSD